MYNTSLVSIVWVVLRAGKRTRGLLKQRRWSGTETYFGCICQNHTSSGDERLNKTIGMFTLHKLPLTSPCKQSQTVMSYYVLGKDRPRIRETSLGLTTIRPRMKGESFGSPFLKGRQVEDHRSRVCPRPLSLTSEDWVRNRNLGTSVSTLFSILSKTSFCVIVVTAGCRTVLTRSPGHKVSREPGVRKSLDKEDGGQLRHSWSKGRLFRVISATVVV